MDTNTENILTSPIGQPMAEILFSRFGQKGTLALWSFVVIAQYVNFGVSPLPLNLFTTRYMMGFDLVGRSCLLLLLTLITVQVVAASRQAFAFSRDGVLPFSSVISRVNSHTHSPVNAVWFVVITAAPLGLLSFAGEQAINGVFSMTVNAAYIAYTIPISARWLGGNDFKPGPFHLGPLVSVRPLCLGRLMC